MENSLFCVVTLKKARDFFPSQVFDQVHNSSNRFIFPSPKKKVLGATSNSNDLDRKKIENYLWVFKL